MQSTLDATLTLSLQRIVASDVGASVGALEANYFGANLVAFAVAIFLVGLLSIASRLEKTAYHYAALPSLLWPEHRRLSPNSAAE